MGNCLSTQEEGAISDAINRHIREEKKEYKVFLMGSGESGKSTIVKQMKIIHQGGYSDEERLGFRTTVYKNVLDSAQAIINQMRKMGVDCVLPTNRLNTDKITDYKVDSSESFIFSAEVAEAIHQLMGDPIIRKVMEHDSFYLMDNANYFFTEVKRIGSPDYIPTLSDILHARAKTTSVTETRFTMDQLSIRMLDAGGQQPERKKWIHCFEGVTSIIFCVALSEYDQVLLEDKNMNRMTDSIMLFESVITSRWFLRTSIILFFNKIDVFKTKLPKVPLENFFPEYAGGSNINEAAKYFFQRFMQKNRAHPAIYPHLTQATDTSNIRRVFTAVKETIVQNALKDLGIL